MARTVFAAINDGGRLRPSEDYEFPDSARVISAGETYIVRSGENFMAGLDPGLSYAQHDGMGNPQLERLGADSAVSALTGDVSGALVGGSTLRFAFVADPDNAAKRAAIYRLSSSDAITAGTTRIETKWLRDPCLEGNEYTIAFCVRPGAWKGLSDDIGLMQVHAADDAPGNPMIFFGIVAGVLRLSIYHNENSPPLQGSSTAIQLYASSDWVEDTWMTFVCNFRWHWLSSQNPYLTAWINAAKIAEYSGLIGYNITGDRAYLKTGVYHYTPPEWVSPLWREAHFKGPFLYRGAISYEEAAADVESI